MGSLSQRIHDEIARSGGWIGFDTFMNLALYAPGQGYYCGGARPFGREGDFETAPMLGPWLAQSIWRWSSPLREAHTLAAREFGGGRGDLALGFLEAARAQGIAVSLEMIELSAVSQALQRERLARFENVAWKSSLTNGFSGLVIANELLDALPVKCFEWQGGDEVLEWGIGSGVSLGEGAAFRWLSRPAQEPLRSQAARRAQAAAQRGLAWPLGYRGEACPWAGPWLRALSDSMESGAVLLIDYGFCESELDHPGRTLGTLCAHSRHRRLDSSVSLLERVGEQDLTAHVNFSAIALEAQSAGFEVDGFVTQARFLMSAGVLDLAQQALSQAGDERQRTLISQALQKLLAESEMGEVFKVMLLTKGLARAVRHSLYDHGFSHGDRLASL
jgi:SAM-dependent MidA family methyltransferase